MKKNLYDYIEIFALKVILKKYILIFLYFIILQACGKNDRDECSIIQKAPNDYLDYWFFKEGSFWVYQLIDSAKTIDTVKVIRVWIETSTPRMVDLAEENTYDHFVACKEHNNLSIQHSNQQYFTPGGASNESYLTTIYAKDENSYYLGNNFCCKNTGSGFLIKYPFVLEDEITNGGHFVDTNSVTTPMQTFNNVIHIFGPANRHYFFSKGIGLVKTIYPDSTEWELITYEL